MTVSIIIAVKTWQANLKECANKCRELDYPDFEILILPDNEGTVPAESGAPIHPIELGAYRTKGTIPLKIIPTGLVSPGEKRDIAVNYAQGEILAFIDDDAYPAKDWLENAVKNFADPQVAAVGGPAITPDTDSIRQKASGLVYASFMVSGGYVYRYLPKKKQEVVDYPSCNFLVRKSVMQELGGFNTDFWPGEDTKLCLDITKKLGKKIIYDPSAVVYHHRRPLFKAHLKQVVSYGLHRGYFVKRFPETSMKFTYFMPSLFILANVLGIILSLLLPGLRPVYLSGVSLYLLLAFISSIKNISLMPWVFPGIILTHSTYGVYFIKGILSSKLKEES